MQQSNQNPHQMGSSNLDGTSNICRESPRIITVKIQSVLDKCDLAAIDMRTDSTLRELKYALKARIGSKSDDQTMLYNNRELKNDQMTLSEYGMIDDCVVQLAPKMASGAKAKQPENNVILIVPYVIPNNVNTIEELRATIKNLQQQKINSNNVGKDANTVKKPEIWTAEKQMEYELTRNRMKELMQKRKKLKAASSKSSILTDFLYTDGGTRSPASDAGSICGSIGRSPLASEPGTPPEIRKLREHNKDPNNNKDTAVEPKDPSTLPFTEKELKTYFEPPETVRQAEMMRRDLYDPPQNREELEKLKKDLQERQKSMCGVCHKRLPLIQQSLKCRCGKVFCTRHRNAEQHKCNVDYKLAGRKKLEKENPKVEGGGAHKAKTDDV